MKFPQLHLRERFSHRRLKGWRNTALFLAGLGIAIHEALLSVDRPSLLMLAAAMMGLPFTFLPGRQQDRDE